MATAQQARPATHASRTQTITTTPVNEADSEAGPSQPAIRPGGVLKLRGASSRKAKVEWSEEVVDNEGMGRKKSKICCIYTKPRAFDESSSESGSGSDDGHENHHAGRAGKEGADKGKGKTLRRNVDGSGADVEEASEPESESDGGGGDGRARPVRKPRKRVPHHHHHDHDHGADGHKCAVKPNKYDSQPRGMGKPPPNI